MIFASKDRNHLTRLEGCFSHYMLGRVAGMKSSEKIRNKNKLTLKDKLDALDQEYRNLGKIRVAIPIEICDE